MIIKLSIFKENDKFNIEKHRIVHTEHQFYGTTDKLWVWWVAEDE